MMNRMPSLVQGSITGDFNKFSGMTVIDRQNLEKIFEEWKEATSDNYSDADRVKIGNLTNASHILTGSISKTASAFMLELAVTEVKSGERKASYPPTPVSTLALENLSAIKTAAADLLRQLGVELSSAAQGELKKAANIAQIQAQTMLSRGIAAQRQGTEVAALSYFFQAAALDKSLLEAANRSSVMAANISSGNIGADVRNDIVWRKNWMARLTETEESFYKMINSSAPPYTLLYSTNIKTGNINYQTETADLSINIFLRANSAWFGAMEQAVLVVLDGLNATNRKNDWNLAGWPQKGVSSTNPFASSKQYDIAVVFELVNEKGRVIGSSATKQNPAFSFKRNENGRIAVAFTKGITDIVNFNGVKADDISDKLTIRVASVNGAPPQNAQFTISAWSEKLVDKRDGKKYNAVLLGANIWMKENLNYQTGNSWCYGGDNANCEKYGRLYDWATAKTSCPSGWHLPSRQEWDDDGAVRDISALVPGGLRNASGRFYEAGRCGNWWTATEGFGGAIGRKIQSRNYREVHSVHTTNDKNDGLSVRCVSDN